MTEPEVRRAWSVAVFARHAGQVLLVHHRRLDLWLPAGGELEPGETPLQAATRELFEETGLRGTFPRTSDLDGAPPGLLGYEEHQAGAKGTHLNFNFLARRYDLAGRTHQVRERRAEQRPVRRDREHAGRFIRVDLAAQ